MNSSGYITFRDWLDALASNAMYIDHVQFDDNMIRPLVDQLLTNDWKSNPFIRIESLGIDINRNNFVELAENIAEQSHARSYDFITQLFAASSCHEYHDHIDFLTNLESAFYLLERKKWKELSNEIENKNETDEEVLMAAFSRIEAAKMKEKLISIEQDVYAAAINCSISANYAGVTNDKIGLNNQNTRFRAKFLLRVAATIVAVIGCVWIFWPDRSREFAQRKEESKEIESPPTDTSHLRESNDKSQITTPQRNANSKVKKDDKATVISPSSPLIEQSYFTSYEVLGEVNRGFGARSRRNIEVEVLSSMPQLERYSMQGDKLRLYVNDLNAFRSGIIIDIDKCLRDDCPKSDCVFYISTQSGFYAVQQVESQANLQKVKDEQTIIILSSYQP